MAEMSQESPLDQQSQQVLERNPGSPNHNAELLLIPTEATQNDDIHGENPLHHQELRNVVQNQDGVHAPYEQNHNTDSDLYSDIPDTGIDIHLHRGGPGDLCLDEGKYSSNNYLDQHPVQDLVNIGQVQNQSSLHDSVKEPGPCERLSPDLEQVKDQDKLSNLNWIQAQDCRRLHNPPESEVDVEAKNHTKCHSPDRDPSQDQQEVQDEGQGPAESQDGQGLPSDKVGSKRSHLFQAQQNHSPGLLAQDQRQDLNPIQPSCLQLYDRDLAQQQDRDKRVDQELDEDRHKPHADQGQQLLEPGANSLYNVPGYSTIQDCIDQTSPRDQDQAVDQGEDHETPLVQQSPSCPDQDLTAGTEDDAGESGGSVPALVITQAEERSALTQPAGEPVTPVKPERPADLVIPLAVSVPTDPSPSLNDGGDMVCSDLMSLKSDSISMTSRRSEDGQEDDTSSMAASSVLSLFHRVQMDPLEKEWLRSSAVGNISAQRQLLAQDPALALKKDFITTALHWAAKQGRLEAVDLMFSCGVDVNVRSGYTALHLASIHGHQHIVQALINSYNAKTNIRDYHGKMAIHYWTGSTDVFNKPEPQSGKLSQGRWTQRYVLPSLLLSRSRSQGQLNLDFGAAPSSPRHEVLEVQI